MKISRYQNGYILGHSLTHFETDQKTALFSDVNLQVVIQGENMNTCISVVYLCRPWKLFFRNQKAQGISQLQ